MQKLYKPVVPLSVLDVKRATDILVYCRDCFLVIDIIKEERNYWQGRVEEITKKQKKKEKAVTSTLIQIIFWKKHWLKEKKSEVWGHIPLHTGIITSILSESWQTPGYTSFSACLTLLKSTSVRMELAWRFVPTQDYLWTGSSWCA